MQALFAQDPSAGFIAALTSSLPILIGISVLGLASFVCFILVVVKMFQNDQTGLGIVTLITSLCGIGTLIAFIYGWIKSSEWNIKTLMLVWTVVTIAYIGLIGYIYTTLAALAAAQTP